MPRRRVRGDVLHVMGRLGKGMLGIAGILGAIGLLSVFFLSLYQFALLTPLLRLETVLVEGADPVIESEILAMAKLHTGLSLAGLRLGKLKEDMEEHPWVRNVQVERRLPHTLVIRVEKEEPMAIVVLERKYFMNVHGELFKRVDAVDPVDMPLVTGIPPDCPEVASELVDALGVLKALEEQTPPWTLENLSELNLGREPLVSLYFTHLKARVEVTLDALPEKIPVLRRVATHLEQAGELKQLRGINLNYTQGAVASFENG